MATSNRVQLKSRSGCLQCKQRKVKCDEVRPTCRNCKRFGDTCRYQPPPTHVQSRSPESNASTSTLHSTSTGLDLSASPAGFALHGCDSLAARRHDLELLHHFTAFTTSTLFDSEEKCNVFQKYAPKLALDRAYLLHAIFALAASHLANSSVGDNARRYADLVTSHHGQALEARPADLNAALERDQDGPFAFSFLLAVGSYTLAWQTIRNDPTEDPASVIVHWFSLTRGIESIIFTSDVADRIMAGQFAVLFTDRDPRMPEGGTIPPEVASQLDAIDRFAEWHEQNSRDNELLRAYYEAIERLRVSYYFFTTPSHNFCRVSSALAWPLLLQQPFVSALVDHRAPAVLVTIHYFLVMHQLKSYWWIGDGPSIVVKALAALLPDDVQSWADWPLQMISRL